MKKIAAIVCTALMTLSLAACAPKAGTAVPSTKDFSGKTVEGLVESVKGSDVTIRLGEISPNALGYGNETADFDLSEAAVKVQEDKNTKDGSISDVTKDSVVSFKVGNDKKVSDVTVRSDIKVTAVEPDKSYDGK
ncbi:MAG: hypothetical protein HUJ55_01365 [Ileibacterium sp.]|nr:hypothetical protein [Ileibacterium sp.]